MTVWVIAALATLRTALAAALVVYVIWRFYVQGDD